MTYLRIISVTLLLFVGAPLVWAQWTSDPALNTAIATKASEQVQPKVKTTSDGGCYISWYDNAAGGYDMYLQRLNAGGVAQWAGGGILIADLHQSSTQDYGLDVDQEDNAILTFRDDRSGDIQITVTKVSPQGVQLWGPKGIQVSAGNASKDQPRVTATEKMFTVAYWGDPTGLRLQRLDKDGAIQWTPGGITIKPPTGATYNTADIHGADSGSVIISFVKYTTFSSPRQLCTGKLDTAGNSLWGLKPVLVYDGGSLQMGNYPPFAYDGHGGAAFSWYTTALQVFVQRILSTGLEAFPHNGVAVATVAAGRTMPTIAFDPLGLDIYTFWREESGGLQGVYGQKVNALGTRQWTNAGAVVQPLIGDEITNVNAVLSGTNSFVYWVDNLPLMTDQCNGQKVDTSGALLCKGIVVSTAPSGKSRLWSAVTPSGITILAWSDTRNDINDLYAQDVLPNCQLGGGLPGEVSPPGAKQPLVFIDHKTLIWEDKSLSGSDTFNLYRGDVTADLPAGSYGSCLADGLTDSTYSDGDLPVIDASFFYLVSGKNAFGEGPLGSDSAGNVRIPGSPCP